MEKKLPGKTGKNIGKGGKMELHKEYALVGATLIDGNGGSPLNNAAVLSITFKSNISCPINNPATLY